MKKVHTNKGFTMAELLIVVAIIAVMVAIAIPTFANQLERSREGVDLSALRNGYTEAKMAMLTAPEDVTFYLYQTPIKQQVLGWTVDTTEFPDIASLENLKVATKYKDGNDDKSSNNCHAADKSAPNMIVALGENETGTVATIVYVFTRDGNESTLDAVGVVAPDGAVTLLPTGKTVAKNAKGTSSFGQAYNVPATANTIAVVTG